MQLLFSYLEKSGLMTKKVSKSRTFAVTPKLVRCLSYRLFCRYLLKCVSMVHAS